MKYIIEISERVVSHVKIDYMDISDNDCAMMCDAVRTAIPYEERPHGEWVDEGLYAENACQHVYQCTHCKEHIVEYPSEMGSYCKYCGSDNRKKSPCDYCIDDSDCDRCDVPLERR